MNLRSAIKKSWLFSRLKKKATVEPIKIESVDLSSVEESPKYGSDRDADLQATILQKRNKSRLNPAHRNVLFGQKPYNENMAFFHDGLLYKRKMLGRYGIHGAGVPAGVAWPTEEELADKKEQERVMYPKTLQEMWKEIEQKHADEKAQIIQREKEITEKMAKLQQWIQEVEQKKAKKVAQLLEAKRHKDKMIEEIRQEFGFTMSLKDPRLKELIEKKELEYQKQQKKAKKEKRESETLKKTLEIAKMLSTPTENKT